MGDTTPVEINRQSGCYSLDNQDPVLRIRVFLQKRGQLILAASALGIGIGGLLDFVLPKLYTAKATIEVQQDRSAEFRLHTLANSGSEVDSARIDTEVEILRSRSMILNVVQRLHLDKDPDFAQCAHNMPCDLSRSADREKIVQKFLDSVEVIRLRRTHLIEIRATTARGELSSAVANGMLSAYIECFRDDVDLGGDSTEAWLSEQLAGLQKRVEESERRMKTVQQEAGIVEMDQGRPPFASEVGELERSLAIAKADHSLREARLHVIDSVPSLNDLPTATNPALESQLENLQEKRSEFSSLSQTYGSAYPKIVELKAQIRALEQDIISGARAQRAEAERAREATWLHENSLRMAVDNSKRRNIAQNAKAIQYETVRKEYEMNHALYLGLMERIEENRIIGGLRSGMIRIVDRAEIPAQPSTPRVIFNLAVGFAIGLFLGMFISVTQEIVCASVVQDTPVPSVKNLPLVDKSMQRHSCEGEHGG